MRLNSIFTKDNGIRKAFNLAVNKKKIIDEILGVLGEEAKGPMPPNMVDKYLNPESINRSDLFLSRWISDTGDLV